MRMCKKHETKMGSSIFYKIISVFMAFLIISGIIFNYRILVVKVNAGETDSIPTLQDGYYIIENYVQLEWFSQLVAGTAKDASGNTVARNTSANARLVANIDMSAYGGSHLPIGNTRKLSVEVDENAYSGIFDGNNHIISGLTSFSTGGYSNAFFGETNGATIKNLKFINANVTTSNDRAAVLVGIAFDTIIEACSIDGTYKLSSHTSTGVLVGNMVSGSVSKSCVSGTITQINGNYVAAFIGAVGWPTISDCYSTIDYTCFVNGDWGGTYNRCYTRSSNFISYAYNPSTRNYCYTSVKRGENDASYFEGFDFDKTWILLDGYPELRGESVSYNDSFKQKYESSLVGIEVILSDTKYSGRVLSYAVTIINTNVFDIEMDSLKIVLYDSDNNVIVTRELTDNSDTIQICAGGVFTLHDWFFLNRTDIEAYEYSFEGLQIYSVNDEFDLFNEYPNYLLEGNTVEKVAEVHDAIYNQIDNMSSFKFNTALFFKTWNDGIDILLDTLFAKTGAQRSEKEKLQDEIVLDIIKKWSSSSVKFADFDSNGFFSFISKTMKTAKKYIGDPTQNIIDIKDEQFMDIVNSIEAELTNLNASHTDFEEYLKGCREINAFRNWKNTFGIDGLEQFISGGKNVLRGIDIGTYMITTLMLSQISVADIEELKSFCPAGNSDLHDSLSRLERSVGHTGVNTISLALMVQDEALPLLMEAVKKDIISNMNSLFNPGAAAVVQLVSLGAEYMWEHILGDPSIDDYLKSIYYATFIDSLQAGLHETYTRFLIKRHQNLRITEDEIANYKRQYDFYLLVMKNAVSSAAKLDSNWDSWTKPFEEDKYSNILASVSSETQIRDAIRVLNGKKYENYKFRVAFDGAAILAYSGNQGASRARTRRAGSNYDILIVPSEIGNIPIRSIEAEAFGNLRNIDEIVISEGIKYIGSKAFENSNGLRYVTLPSSVDIIENDAFVDANLDALIIENPDFVFTQELIDGINSDTIINAFEGSISESLVVPQEVELNSAEVIGVNIYSLPNQTECSVNETPSYDGLSLKATYADGTSKIITDDFAVDMSGLRRGTNTIRVLYAGFVCTYEQELVDDICKINVIYADVDSGNVIGSEQMTKISGQSINITCPDIQGYEPVLENVIEIVERDGQTIYCYYDKQLEVLITDLTISNFNNKVFGVESARQTPTIKDNGNVLQNGIDYSLHYSNIDSLGNATMYIVGQGRYLGAVRFDYEIAALESPSDEDETTSINETVSEHESTSIDERVTEDETSLDNDYFEDTDISTGDRTRECVVWVIAIGFVGLFAFSCMLMSGRKKKID